MSRVKTTALILHPLVAGKIRKERIKKATRFKAHEIYVRTGRKQGNDLDNWLMAEKQILEEFGELNIFFSINYRRNEK